MFSASTESVYKCGECKCKQKNFSPFNVVKIIHSLHRSVSCIDVSNNQIENLTTSLRKMGNLASLKVGNNHLSSLPQPFGFLRSLTEVDLSNNAMEGIVVVGPMPRKIKSLKANGNNFKGNAFLIFSSEEIPYILIYYTGHTSKCIEIAHLRVLLCVSILSTPDIGSLRLRSRMRLFHPSTVLCAA